MEIRRGKSEQKRFEKFFHDRFMESVDITHPIDGERDDALEERLIQCMEKLKQEQYSCIRLFYYENCCYKEIAGKHTIQFEFTVDEKGALSGFEFESYPHAVFVWEIQNAVKSLGHWVHPARDGEYIPSKVKMELTIEVQE